MTEKQIAQAKQALYAKYCDKDKNAWSKKDLRLEQELCCRNIINNLLIYGGNCDEGGQEYEKFLALDVKDKSITKRRLNRLIQEQKATIAKATIIVDGYKDDDGCYRNVCIYEDD